MCGLLGWQYGPNSAVSMKQRRAIASSLADDMDQRGGDSWGYYAPEARVLNRGIGWLSFGIRPSTLARHDTLIGHTRYATTGAVTIANAHPFSLGTLTGAHNGMVTNHDELNRRYRPAPVDSIHLLRALDEGTPLDEVCAYGAVTFAYHDDETRIYLGRFNGGSLAVAKLKRGGTVYASTSEALTIALAIAGLDYTEYECKDGALYTLFDGRMYETEFALDCAPAFLTSRRSVSHSANWSQWPD
jgi:asparagine synthetase B (glutamine-hydrolysing)